MTERTDIKKFSQFTKVTDGPIDVVGLKDGDNVKAELTTDLVAVNPSTFRNDKGQFIGTPEELEALKNQRDVNEFLYKSISDIEQGDVNLEGYATEEWVEGQINAIPETDVSGLVSKSGDTMTGPLEVDDVVKADIIKSTKVDSGEDTNLSIQRYGSTKFLLASTETLAYQPVRYNADYKLDHERNLITKGYVDELVEETVTDADGAYVQKKKDGGDDMEGPLRINAQEASDGRGTNYVQTLGVFSKSDGSALRLGTTRDRVYIGHNDTSFNGPIKLEEIQSKKEGEGVPLTDEGTKDDHLITKGYVDGGDRQLQAEIDQIALALETLLVQREHGQWKYIGFSGDNIPRNAGEFSLASDDLSANENIITLNQEDLKGITHGFGDVEVGDYVEIVDLNDPANYVLFVVTKAPEGTGISNVEVALKDKGQNILIGETCEIRFFAVNEQDINLTDLDNRYVNKSGDTMTGTLTVPRFEAKDFESEAVCLIAGKATGTATASRLTFSNTGYQNAYGSIEWHGQNASGWFQINKDVDFGTNGLNSVNNIRLVGNKAIQEAQTTRIKFDGKVIVTRTGDNKDGFTIKGRDDSNLLSVYHNSSDLDSINYTGKTGGSTNLATCGYVDSRLGGSKGALISHMERLWKKGNGTDGKTFYFQNQNGSPSSSMNDFRKFKWKLPASHYLMPMVGAGRNMGYVVITNMSGQLQYQCQVSNSDKTNGYITLELDHENRYGSNMMGDDSYYIVHLFAFLREAE